MTAKATNGRVVHPKRSAREKVAAMVEFLLDHKDFKSSPFAPLVNLYKPQIVAKMRDLSEGDAADFLAFVRGMIDE